ncbi:MAG: restriction endonuclease subunit S [Cohaesibacter sp.]|jgi:type I restriction enzyme S subunit|nr:restriction endonuclease subunit S [Cohaesibacter sp.]
MSELPKGWVEAEMREACSVITDGTHHSPENGPEGEFKYITAKNIKRHGLDLSKITYVDEATHRQIYNRCPVQTGDILYIKDGATTGLAIVNPLEEQFSMLSSVALIRPVEGFLDNLFLKCQLNSPSLFTKMTGDMTGSAIRRLTLKTIGRQPVSVPPLAEQKRIVAKVEALSAKSARARTHLAQIENLVKRYKQAVLSKAFSGELTKDWRAGTPHTNIGLALDRVRDDRKNSRKLSRRKPVREYPIERLPQDWAWISPDELASDSDYSIGIGPFGSNLVKADYRTNGVRLVFVRDIRTESFSLQGAVFVDQDKASELHQHVVDSGDLLITKMGDPPGDTAIFPNNATPAIITADCIKLRPHSALSSSAYLYFAARTVVFQEQILSVTKGVAHQKVSLDRFRQLAFPVAPLPEQTEIVRRIESAFAKIDRLAAEAKRALELTDRLDDAILAKAFRGELVPQDPDDEPASVLLDRIKAARAAAPKPKRSRKKKA